MRRLASFILMAAMTAPCIADAAALRQPDVSEVWGSFKAISSAIIDPHVVQTVKIERATPAGTILGPEIWEAEQITETSRAGVLTTEHHWADSRSCPALIPTLASLAKLEPITIQPPGIVLPDGRDMPPGWSARDLRLHDGGGEGRIFDGGDFEIDAPGRWAAARMAGSVVLRGGAGTPAAIWVQSALRALAPCWSAAAPG